MLRNLLLLALTGYLLGHANELIAESSETSRSLVVVILRPPDRIGDAYLDSAKAYFRAAGAEPLEADSLTQLHNLLVRRFEREGAIGEVVLVAHGSTWTGVSIALFPDGPDASVSNMRQARQAGAFPPLPDGSVDGQTRITLESCAVGRHSAWLRAFAELWVPPDESPVKVQASVDFVAFGQMLGAGGEFGLKRLILPANVAVVAEQWELDGPTRQFVDSEDCAPIPAPCEQRLLPIRVTVDLDRSLAGKSFALRRRYAQQQARQELLDLNLRPEQLDWRWERTDETASQRWEGVGTAIVTTPTLIAAQ